MSQDYAPPYWVVRRLIDVHIGPFSSRADAVTALAIAPTPGDWEILSDDEFRVYLNERRS